MASSHDRIDRRESPQSRTRVVQQESVPLPSTVVVGLQTALCILIYGLVLGGAAVVAGAIGSLVPGYLGVAMLLTVGFGLLAAAPEIAGWSCHAVIDRIEGRRFR